jgi:hypothetical protein
MESVFTLMEMIVTSLIVHRITHSCIMPRQQPAKVLNVEKFSPIRHTQCDA